MENKIIFRCKPCFNYQSIEFEVESDPDDIAPVIDLYKRVLDKLVDIAPDQPGKVSVKTECAKPKADLATKAQREIMDKFGIAYTASTTKKEAGKLIEASVKKAAAPDDETPW